MAKITISSTRVYYNELDINSAFSIHSDICTYQSMLHKSYKELYNNHNINSKYLKDIYHTNDYFPLSTISEAKGILKSQKTWHHKTISIQKKKLKKIEKKLKEEMKLYNQYTMTKHSLIYLSKNDSVSHIYRCRGLKWFANNPDYCIYNNKKMLLYIFEVQYLNPLIKCTRNRIKQLKFRKERTEHKIHKLEEHMKQISFKHNSYMKITGRSQGKYCNNLFKYDYDNKLMTYIDTNQNRIVFPLTFPYRGEELKRVLSLPHATPHKAVCYTLVDKGEYFIIYATIELDINYNDYLFEITNGTVGIDINDNHISLTEIDNRGNLLCCKDYKFNLRDKTKNQRNWIIENTVNKVLDYCVSVGKPLIIEELDFDKKKREFELYNKDKKYHRMLSEFSYRKIIEKLYSRAYKCGIGINEVSPAYTSVIGRLKYSTQKGITVHKAASYVIARRGMGYKERLPRKLYNNINEPLLIRWKRYNEIMNCIA